MSHLWGHGDKAAEMSWPHGPSSHAEMADCQMETTPRLSTSIMTLLCTPPPASYTSSATIGCSTHAKLASAVQLKVKITRQQAAREQKLRRKNLTKYIPNAAAAVFKVLQSMAGAPAVGSKRRRLQDEEDILEPVTRGETVEATLAQRLTEYVERIDTDMVSVTIAKSMHFDMHMPAAWVFVHAGCVQGREPTLVGRP